ncbi:50S ribosomal protein L29, partial [Desulfobacteraceae bacterium SEEP-SAG9]
VKQTKRDIARIKTVMNEFAKNTNTPKD